MAGRTNLSFEGFVDFQFGRAVPTSGWPWYLEVGGDWWSPEPRTGISYLTQLFSDGARVLESFSDAQIAQGLDGLINAMAVGDQPWMRDPITPAEERAAAWTAVADFYRDVLAPGCSPVLSHLSEEGRPLNNTAYMWWESFPGFTNQDDPDRELVDLAELAALERILALDCIACQEGALHGLGHWVRRNPRCEAIIDRYLDSGRASRPELLAYAKAARCGCLL